MAQIKVGKFRTVLETRQYAQGVKVALPMLTAKGARPGPLAVVTANQHGRELQGIASIERAWSRIDVKKLRGTVVFLPVMNPIGARVHIQDYPVEQTRYRPTGIQLNMNLNRKWGADQPLHDGTYAGEIARVVHDTFLRHADLAIDLHGWSGLSLSWAWSGNPALLRAFGLPWIHESRNRPKGHMHENAAARAGADWVTCELAPQNQLHTGTVHYGERGILNALVFKGMLEGRLELPEVQYAFAAEHEEIELRTPGEGLIDPDCVKGQWVKKGTRVLRVLSLETLKPVYEALAPKDCIVYNVGGIAWGEDQEMNYVVYPGQITGLLKVPARIIRYDADGRPTITPVG